MENHDPSSSSDLLFRRQALEASRSRLGSPVRPLGVASWIVTGMFCFILIAVGVFASLANYARKETAVGALEPAQGAIRIVAPRAGVLGSSARQGDHLRKGQPIATLKSDTVTEGGATLSDLLSNASVSQTVALRDQARAHAELVLRQREELDAKKKALNARLVGLRTDLGLAQQRVRLKRQTLDAVERLHANQYFSDFQYRSLQEALLEAQQAESQIVRESDEARASIAELSAQEHQLAAARDEALAQTRAAAADLDAKTATVAGERSAVLIAPADSRVLAVYAKPGAAVSAGETVAMLSPEGARLEASLWVPSRAIGLIRKGAPVRLMYDAFPYQTFGVGHGRVQEIADAPTRPQEIPLPIETHEGLYRVTVVLEEQAVEGYGKTWPLTPGSRLSADVVLESRSFLSWLLDPIIALRRRAG